MRKRGISLIVLIITIIVIIVIAGAVILTLSNGGILDQAKKARFMNDYTSVQDGVNLYSFSKYNEATTKFELPLKGYLTAEDKTYIKETVPTLNTKIEELSGSIDTANLAWISSENINVNLSNEKEEKGYIIDVTNGQIYDYIGDVFENKRWHTLDGGVVIGETTVPKVVTDELWDGWIKLTLYYPSGSTEKKWRLGTEGELRADPMLMWQSYTGPITIPLDRVHDVWIKYIIDGKEVTIPPVGTLLVDIVPDKTGTTKVASVKVNINYDESSTIKEYRVGDSGWITYSGEFTVTENCIIEARAKKTETIYNTDGSVLITRDVAGRDLVYIGNVGIEEIETSLEAPTITRLPGVGDEKARVQIIYPAGADKKIYKVNYGTEENYTSEISVTTYGTYIIAYYYDASGKKSNVSAIRINDTSTGTTPEPPGPYDPKPPYDPGNPLPPYDPGPYGTNVPAPSINITPSTLAEEVQLSIVSPVNADKVYVKLGRYADYQLYTSSITVRQNTEVYAYYKTYTGERSDTGYKIVSNIKKNNKPYVYIDANPYPWSSSYGASSVTVTINYSDTNTIEYSEDGIVYTPYTAPFTVTKNGKIYARGTNTYGVTETSLNITNIGEIIPPKPTINLLVGINVNPEPSLSTDRITKANVTIDYDSKATEKYYRIGRYGALQTYTGAFDVTSNCTVYAYAKGENAAGQTYKTIDNLTTGIAQPVISGIPDNSVQSSKVNLTISFDKYAIIKKYSLNGGELRDYGTSFDVSANGTVVYAYSENELGQKSESSYTVENIAQQPPVLVLDKGQYYILKLNYPEISKNREYKWKENGTWTGYKDEGILLLKPQYKDSLIQNGTLVKIEDENGNLVTFTGDYYFIDVPISELFENLFMRWDRQPLDAPQIIISPSDPAIRVTADIVYNSALIKKQYKIIKPGEVSADWQDYTGPITIDRNNTIIYAKGMDDTEVWTTESIKKIINIDENPPVIKLTADLDTAQQKVAVKVNVADDVEVGKVKWVSGIQGENYFINSGTEIINNGIVNITGNGYYTFYAEDKVGNKQVYTLNITNVDLTAPAIDIVVNPEDIVGLTANVTINYGDATLKQYKVGTSNATWSTYTNSFEISSYTILANNWQNSDGTVTIYAKGKDSAGNEIMVQKKVVSLDLDAPKTPIIVSSAGYPILKSTGVDLNSSSTITYDTRTDIDNYYSLDNGATWQIYTGSFNYPAGTIIAKSVKKSSGLEVIVSKTITMPSYTILPGAYDGNLLTDFRLTYNDIYYKMLVDSSMLGKKFKVVWSSEWGDRYIACLDVNNVQLAKYTCITAGEQQFNIPAGTVSLGAMYSGLHIKEIGPGIDPTINIINNNYAKLTTTGVEKGYTRLTISYFSTSAQRLYKIGANGIWKSYEDQEIKLSETETIYTKGIDQYGNESTIISYTAPVIATQIGPAAYDGTISTNYTTPDNYIYYYLNVDNSMVGRNFKVTWSSDYTGRYIACLNASNVELARYTIPSTASVEQQFYIPAGTVKLGAMYLGLHIKEIGPGINPTINVVKSNIAKLTTTGVDRGYRQISVLYFPTNVQRLYKIGTNGEWKSYEDKEIILYETETIYTKGIDQYGNESTIISYTAPVIDTQIGPTAYDGNKTTYFRTTSNDAYDKIAVDSSMQGRYVRVNWSSENSNRYITCLNSSNAELSKLIWTTPGEVQLYIPVGTVMFAGRNYGLHLEEIGPGINPTITPKSSYYPKLISTGIIKGYTPVTVLYFTTSVQRLYKIGINGEWKPYEDKDINVNEMETIYTKGIDQYGNESSIISYTAGVIADQIGPLAYDKNESTSYMTPSNDGYYKMLVDPSMYGKTIRINWSSPYANRNIKCLNSVGGILDTYTVKGDQQYTIPQGTYMLAAQYSTLYIYEINPID